MVNTRSLSGQQATGAADSQGTEGMQMDPPGSTTSDTPADEQLEETVEERYERIVAQVKLRRMEESIQAFEAELAGDTRAPRMEIAGLPIREKRPASSGPSNPPVAQMPRLAKPPTFKGRNLKEAAEYESGWKIHLEASRPMTDQERIAYAATYLDDCAHAAWGQEDRPSIDTWDAYIA
jgi:hypothetical protein